ncbi:MAG: phosphoribosylformylglycinamidine synthase subunit PurL [Planctomycetaceae bacterium]|nr:phosphoribosylformylglycinamidine synthase subunit PurL [Planctomycetaceae bacterium]
MLWEVEIQPVANEKDYEGQRVLASARNQGISGLKSVKAARTFLLQGNLTEQDARKAAEQLLVDPVTETFVIHELGKTAGQGTDAASSNGKPVCLNVLFHPGVTDSVAENAAQALNRLSISVTNAATCRRYWVTGDLAAAQMTQLTKKVLANDAIEYVVKGDLQIRDLSVGSEYKFRLTTVPIRDMDDDALMVLSKKGQLYLSIAEMKTVQAHYQSLQRDPTDIELETIAQTWSEHCSHKTLGGRIHYVETSGGKVVRDTHFKSMLKETIFAATVEIRQKLGANDWCVSVFKDNAGIVKFDDRQNVCIKVETHNHPSAIEPYGGANTGLGGVIRDPLGTGLGAKPVCNTDVFCFARPDYPADQLPPGVLHPQAVMQGVVSGVRDYGNRMGIPTVNGAVCFDDRYLGNPLVYCGNVAMIPVDKCDKHVSPGDLIVAVGGRTGRDGIHGATFSSVELTEESEHISGGAVQIGNPVTEKMMMDVILAARDRGLYSAITDCGAGGFSSAVGEMGEETGAEVWLDKAPLKYSGLSYTEIWISEAQERMVLAVPPKDWEEFRALCASEGVEATAIGQFTNTKQLVLKYGEHQVGSLSMDFLHDGRPPVIREAVYEIKATGSPLPRGGEGQGEGAVVSESRDYTADLKKILGSLNVASKEWIIRQYDHEVQAGSVIKPLVGINNDGPSDAAVVRPDLKSKRGLVVSCGINPHFGDYDPYWMAASAIDESVRNCVAVGANPDRIAILDNFCWGNTERPETLGTLVRAAVGCQDIAVAYGTPFVSGKDSLNNEFSYEDATAGRRTVAIPSTLLITALGQVDDVEQCVTMDLKGAGNLLFLIGETKNEMGGSHFNLVNGLAEGTVPTVDKEKAPKVFRALHQAIRQGLILSCHDLSEGGLAVAAAEMAFAGGVGVELQVESGSSVELFSESNTRFLVEVPASAKGQLESVLGGVVLQQVGRTTAESSFRAQSKNGVHIQESLSALKECWQSPLSL